MQLFKSLIIKEVVAESSPHSISCFKMKYQKADHRMCTQQTAVTHQSKTGRKGDSDFIQCTHIKTFWLQDWAFSLFSIRRGIGKERDKEQAMYIF